MTSQRSLLYAAIALCTLACSGYHQSSEPAPGQAQAGPSAAVGPARGGLEEALRGLVVEDGRIRALAASPPATAPALTPGALDLRLQQLFREGRKGQALRLAVRAVRSSPGDAGMLCALSYALRRSRLLEEAAAAARTAIDLAPREAAAHAALARSLEKLGQHHDAIAAWETAAALPPSTLRPLAEGAFHRRLAALYALTGDREAAAWHVGLAPATNWPLAGARTRAQIVGEGAGLEVAVGPAVRIDTGGGTSHAAEVSLAATTDGVLVAAWNDLREADPDAWRLGWATSDDGGLTWNDDLLRAPGAPPEDFAGDPMTAFDPRTGTLWVGGTHFFQELYLSRRLAGAEFTPPANFVEGLFVDRAQLAVGPDPSSPEATLLHVAHFSGLQTSADLGETWGPVVAWGGDGYAQHPTTGPDGELYITYADFTDRIFFQRSLDGGATLEPPVEVAVRMDVWDAQEGFNFPGHFRVPPLPFLASSPVDGTLYCLYFDTTEIVDGEANVDLYLTVSSDRGATWSTPTVVNGDADPPGDQFLPWIEVDAAGRVHLIFFDTRNTPQLDDAEDAQVDVYHSVSADRGVTWTESRLTQEPFGTAVIAWPIAGQPQFLGDYLGLATAGDRTWAIYPSTENGDLDVFVREIIVGTPAFPELTVAKSGAGNGRVTSDPAGIDCGVACSATFANGTEVTLSATADAGSSFEGWSGEGCSGQDVCTVPMTRARNVTASFSDANDCVVDDTTLCLNGGRFQVRATWQDFVGGTGNGHRVPFGSDDSGLLWFFGADNWEVLIKVINGCGFNDRYWVFAAATTNVAYTLRILDTVTGDVVEYSNPLGNRAAAITDTAAFATCP